jgi:hypothetical protein
MILFGGDSFESKLKSIINSHEATYSEAYVCLYQLRLYEVNNFMSESALLKVPEL